MTVLIMCRRCGTRYRIPKSGVSHKMRCRQCGARLAGTPLRADIGPFQRVRRTRLVVWGGTAGGVLILLIGMIFFWLHGEAAGPNENAANPGGAQIQAQAAPPPPAENETLEDRLRKAKAHEDEAHRREQKELQEFDRLVKWTRRYRKVMADWDSAFWPLINPVIDALQHAAGRAIEKRDQRRSELLSRQLTTFSQHPLRLPRAEEVRTEVVEYIGRRLEVERGFVRKLTALKATEPESASVGDKMTLDERLASAKAAVKRLEAARTAFAALPGPGIPVAGGKGTIPTPSPNPMSSDAGRPGKSPPPGDKHPIGPAPADWAVTSDPPKDRPEFPAHLPYRELAVGETNVLVYPPGPSGYLAIGDRSGNVGEYAIADLHTGGIVAAIRGLDGKVDLLDAGGPALSSEGAYLALINSSTRKPFIVVHRLRFGRKTFALPLVDSNSRLLFPTPTQLLAVPTANKAQATLWDLTSGTVVRRFHVITSPAPESGRMACSPGGRYLAIAGEGSTPGTVYFYDLTTGKQAGTLVPEGRRPFRPFFTAFAFSPDGTEFAAYLVGIADGMNASEAMACWDLKTGRLLENRILDRGPGRGALNTVSPEPLQWFPDGKGWLLFQRYVVDRAAGAVVQTLSDSGEAFGYFGTKILDDRRILASAVRGRLQVTEVRRSADASAK